MRFAAFQVVDSETRPAHLAREQNKLVSEQSCVGDEASIALADEIAPIRLLRRIARRDNNLEIGRPRVGPDKQAIAVVHNFVAEPRPARRDEPGRDGRMVEIDDQGLRGVVAMHRYDGRAAEARRLYADEPGRVGFHEHLDVVGLRGPQAMQHNAARAVTLVLLDIEKRLRIARPHDVSGRPGDAVDKVRLALEVADGNGEDLGAEVVGAPGEF